MVPRIFVAVLAVLLISGCIESGNLSLPSDKGGLDLSSLTAQLQSKDKAPGRGELGVPLKALPSHYLRSDEEGSYTEVFTLKGLPSTRIVWRVEKDPYGRLYNELKDESTRTDNLDLGPQNISASVVDRPSLYKVSAHIGLYTFSAETTAPDYIDEADLFGSHEEVVLKIFEAGLNNALAYDLDSPGN